MCVRSKIKPYKNNTIFKNTQESQEINLIVYTFPLLFTQHQTNKSVVKRYCTI